MQSTLHLPFKNVSGYGLLEGTCLPCTGLSKNAATLCLSHRLKIGTLACPPKRAFLVCRASSSGKRRNPDGPSRGRSNQNDDLGLDSWPAHSISNSPSHQSTSTPGTKEKEIAELFRKVQLQLRERAASKNKEEKKQVVEAAAAPPPPPKEEKKQVVEAAAAPPPPPKEESKSDDSISSLLELLRKHSVKNDDNGKDRSAQNGALSNGMASNSYNNRKNRDKASKFVRKSPISRNSGQDIDKPVWDSRDDTRKKFEDDTLDEPEDEFEMESDDEFSSPKSSWTSSGIGKKSLSDREEEPEVEEDPDLDLDLDLDLDSESDSDIEFDLEPEPEPEPERETEAILSEDANAAEEEVDLSSMKVVELRELAKARGLTKTSKLKKAELIELLSRSSV